MLRKNSEGLSTRRLEREESKLIVQVYALLKPVVRKLVARKNMLSMIQECEQHAYIAIHRAIDSWDSNISSFSTYVHWQIRAELGDLQHKMYPERRKVQTLVPVKMLELDRPMNTNDGNSATMGDFLVDEIAETRVEDAASQYVAKHCLERIFSHYLARKQKAYESHEHDLAKIEEHRYNLMRNRDIYLRYRVGIGFKGIQKYKDIAAKYEISRERVRQIVARVEADLKGQLPALSECGMHVIEATKQPPASIHPDWMLFVMAFHNHHSNVDRFDPRLVDRETPIPANAPRAVNSQPMIESLNVDPPAVPAVVVPVDGQDRMKPVIVAMSMGRDIDVRLHRKAGLLLTSLMAVTAMATPAAAQTSRAIPPEYEAATRPAEVVIDPIVRTREGARATARKRTESQDGMRYKVIPASQVKANPSIWGIQVGRFADADALQKNWYKTRNSWNWLRGLYPFSVSNKGKGVGLVFGPMNQEQAVGMCHEAKRVRMDCAPMALGKTQMPKREAQREVSKEKAG